MKNLFIGSDLDRTDRATRKFDRRLNERNLLVDREKEENRFFSLRWEFRRDKIDWRDSTSVDFERFFDVPFLCNFLRNGRTIGRNRERNNSSSRSWSISKKMIGRKTIERIVLERRCSPKASTKTDKSTIRSWNWKMREIVRHIEEKFSLIVVRPRFESDVFSSLDTNHSVTWFSEIKGARQPDDSCSDNQTRLLFLRSISARLC